MSPQELQTAIRDLEHQAFQWGKLTLNPNAKASDARRLMAMSRRMQKRADRLKRSLPPEEQKPGDDSEIRRLLDEAELKQAFFQDAADKACRGEPEALASLQRLAESALSAARNVRKQKPGDVKGGAK